MKLRVLYTPGKLFATDSHSKTQEFVSPSPTGVFTFYLLVQYPPASSTLSHLLSPRQAPGALPLLPGCFRLSKAKSFLALLGLVLKVLKLTFTSLISAGL